MCFGKEQNELARNVNRVKLFYGFCTMADFMCDACCLYLTFSTTEMEKCSGTNLNFKKIICLQIFLVSDYCHHSHSSASYA